MSDGERLFAFASVAAMLGAILAIAVAARAMPRHPHGQLGQRVYRVSTTGFTPNAPPWAPTAPTWEPERPAP